jgi:hypothetical protein
MSATRHTKDGIFNFADSDTYVSTRRARHQLGWDPAFRLVMPVWPADLASRRH